MTSQLTHRFSRSLQVHKPVAAGGRTDGEAAVLSFPRVHPQRRPRNCTHTWVQPDVLAMVGHELRQPLAALLVSAELIADSLDELDRQQLMHLLTTIQQRVLGLQVLVNNLMQSANGNFTLRSEAFDIADLVADVRLTVEPLLARTEQSLQVDATTLTVMADRARLAQVLVNLILNASKFSPPRSAIELEFSLRGSVVWVAVADRGKGLPPGPTDWLFELAARADHSATGLGLGLAIVRSIVEAHGGRVGAANQPGGGARFWFTLPHHAEPQSSALS